MLSEVEGSRLKEQDTERYHYSTLAKVNLEEQNLNWEERRQLKTKLLNQETVFGDF